MIIDRQRQIEGLICLAAFGACIPAANWLIGNAGTFCVPNGPCVIPVAPGITAPSGVLMSTGNGLPASRKGRSTPATRKGLARCESKLITWIGPGSMLKFWVVDVQLTMQPVAERLPSNLRVAVTAVLTCGITAVIVGALRRLSIDDTVNRVFAAKLSGSVSTGFSVWL